MAFAEGISAFCKAWKGKWGSNNILSIQHSTIVNTMAPQGRNFWIKRMEIGWNSNGKRHSQLENIRIMDRSIPISSQELERTSENGDPKCQSKRKWGSDLEEMGIGQPPPHPPPSYGGPPMLRVPSPIPSPCPMSRTWFSLETVATKKHRLLF